jgi:hypothetical protein
MCNYNAMTLGCSSDSAIRNAATLLVQVLLLDYDCTPLLDPTALFGGPHMTLHGNLFWPDLPDGGETRPPINKAAEALGMNSKEVLVS